MRFREVPNEVRNLGGMERSYERPKGGECNVARIFRRKIRRVNFERNLYKVHSIPKENEIIWKF